MKVAIVLEKGEYLENGNLYSEDGELIVRCIDTIDVDMFLKKREIVNLDDPEWIDDFIDQINETNPKWLEKFIERLHERHAFPL